MHSEFEVMEIFGQCVLLSDERKNRNEIQSRFAEVQLYFYDIRGSDDDPEMPCVVESKPVQVNYVGTIISLKPLLDYSEEYKIIGDLDLHYPGESWKLEEYVQFESLTPKPVKFAR